MAVLRSPGAVALAPSTLDFVVVCLCAEWCGTCRDYRPGFDELAAEFPDARFLWIDIEDDAEKIGDLDIENFPTLLIKRHGTVVFFGTMLPHLGHLRRLLESYATQTDEELCAYLASDPLRQSWQENADLLAIGQD